MRTLFLILGLLLTSLPAMAQSIAEKPAGTDPASASQLGVSTNGINSKATNQFATVLQPSTNSPLVSLRILFRTGAANDPAGKEGVASLTAAMVAEGGSQKLAYEEILKRMYPMATSFEWQVDKEMTVFSGTTHVDNLFKFYGLIKEMLFTPGFREDDFNRLKTDALNFLKVSLREGNDEELGKEVLYNTIYEAHPYGHHNIGRISTLEKLTAQDVRNFYRSNYTQANLVLGLAGGYPEEFLKRITADLNQLPPGMTNEVKVKFPELEEGTRIRIIGRETRSTAISLGFPIDVRRGHEDWAALYLVASYFGQHRSSNSYLYQRLRELRGLNYGDYSYIEYFPRGMFQFQPDPNLARQQQIFQIWLRPVPLGQGFFTLRAALFELDKLIEKGISEEDFEATRQFLSKYVHVLTGTEDSKLGYALDSQYYGIPPYVDYVKSELEKLTLERVNAAIKRNLKSQNLRIIMVTKDAQALRDQILAGKPSPITYNSPKTDEVLEEDKLIEKYEIVVKPEAVVAQPVEQIFQ